MGCGENPHSGLHVTDFFAANIPNSVPEALTFSGEGASVLPADLLVSLMLDLGSLYL